MLAPRDLEIAPTHHSYMMTATTPILNPPAHHLGTANAIMGSAGAGRHHVSHFTGPLSIKFMVRGSGVWRSDAGVHHVEEGYFLVLNRGQTYTLDIDSDLPRESFCPFFRRGFVEDIHRTLTTTPARLLEEPADDPPPLTFRQNLHTADRRVVPAMLALRELVYGRGHQAGSEEEGFLRLAEALLVHAMEDLRAEIARVPAARSSTRAECHRRVARGRDYLHANAHRSVTLEDLAAHACLSPYHFHRQFKAVHRLAPHQYLTRLRLQRAARLLRDSDMSVIDVAMTVGFTNPAAFSRRFTRAYGAAPGRYRARA